jgi:hypothetical protein
MYDSFHSAEVEVWIAMQADEVLARYCVEYARRMNDERRTIGDLYAESAVHESVWSGPVARGAGAIESYLVGFGQGSMAFIGADVAVDEESGAPRVLMLIRDSLFGRHRGMHLRATFAFELDAEGRARCSVADSISPAPRRARAAGHFPGKDPERIRRCLEEPMLELSSGMAIDCSVLVTPDLEGEAQALCDAIVAAGSGRFRPVIRQIHPSDHRVRGSGLFVYPSVVVSHAGRFIRRIEGAVSIEATASALRDLLESPPTFDPFELYNSASEETRSLMRVKGTQRRSGVSQAIAMDGLHAVPPMWLEHDLPEHMRGMLGARRPGDRGGEDLPDLADGEIELARVALDTVHCEVLSLRVRRFEGDGRSVRLTQEEDGSGVEDLPLADSSWVEAPTWERVVRCFFEPDGGPLGGALRYSVSSSLRADIGMVATELVRFECVEPRGAE